MDPRAERLLDGAPGPAPWSWKSFPAFRIGTRSWSWRSGPLEGGRDWPMLVREWDGAACFVPGRYTYVTRGDEETLLVWRSALSGSVDVRFHLLTQLEPVDPREEALDERDLVSRRASERVQLPQLDAGTHHGYAARTAVDAEELLLLAHRPGVNETDPRLAIYAWRPASGVVTVTPQPWFTSATHDLGHEWVTKIARDPTTGRIVGTGIRLGAFELEDDDLTVRQWLTDARGQPLD